MLLGTENDVTGKVSRLANYFSCSCLYPAQVPSPHKASTDWTPDPKLLEGTAAQNIE